MALVALGQSKMVVRPIAGFFHILIYVGFVLINIEVLEILIDGALEHTVCLLRWVLYTYIAIGFFEVLGLLVLVSCLVFLARRYLVRIKRFTSGRAEGFPNKDAASILIVESVLMVALLVMNAADTHLQEAAFMPVTSWLALIFSGNSEHANHPVIEIAWWFHYEHPGIPQLPAFFQSISISFSHSPIRTIPACNPKRQFTNMESVTSTEVTLMMDPLAVPPE